MNTDKLREDFTLLRDPTLGKKRIKDRLNAYEKNVEDYLAFWYSLSKENTHVYPSQGILQTPYDYLDCQGLSMLPQEKIIKTLRLRWFFLELFNHPYRIYHLKAMNRKKFTPPQKVASKAFDYAQKQGLTLSVGDLGAKVVGSDKPRSSRTDRYAQGPFVKLGKQARSIYTGSDSPDVWNSSAAISTMAASHSIATIPRNGVLVDHKRQSDLAKEVFDQLDMLRDTLLKGRSDKKRVSEFWRKNVGAVIENNSEKALKRAEVMYKAGVRLFRIYSPEPGNDIVEVIKRMRKVFGREIEIFAGEIVDTKQAKAAEEAGADGLFVGIGGGGRCITGVRSGSAIEWPHTVWNLRGEIGIPVVVEGGASDHIAITLLLGASGISTSRIIVGGTIESPGGALFCVDAKGKMFKPYGGEASARTKYLEGKILPFEVPSFVEGETTKAKMNYIKHALPTLTYNLHMLNEDAILAMVFRNTDSLEDLHGLDPSPLQRSTSFDVLQRNTH